MGLMSMARSKAGRTILKVLLFVWLLATGWQWMDIPVSYHIQKGCLFTSDRTGRWIYVAWMGLHGYITGYLIWGSWRGAFSRQQPPGIRKRRVARIILGAVVLLAAYVALYRAWCFSLAARAHGPSGVPTTQQVSPEAPRLPRTEPVAGEK